MTAKERAAALNFGDLLKHYTTAWAKKLTQDTGKKVKPPEVYRRVGKELGITTDTLYKYARNESIPGLDYAYRIARCLDFRLDELSSYAERAMKPQHLENYPSHYLLEQAIKIATAQDFDVMQFQKQKILDLVSSYCQTAVTLKNDDLLKEIACVYAKEQLSYDGEQQENFRALMEQFQQNIEQLCNTWKSTLELISSQSQGSFESNLFNLLDDQDTAEEDKPD